MGRFRKILLYIMIPVALILVLEGVIYYSEAGLTVPGVILCTLENAVMAFIARPTVSAFFAFRTINEGYSQFSVIVTHLYGAVLIIAPILTTTAVLSGFQSYVLDFGYSLKMTTKGRMYVIGDGKIAGVIAEKYAKTYFVHYLMPSKTENKTRLPFLKKKVWAYPIDYSNMPLTLKECKMEKAACIVLNFSSWFENQKSVNEIFSYLMENSSDEPTPLCIVDAPTLYRDIFKGMYKGLCTKYSRPETVLKVSFLNTHEINARKFFENPEFTVQPQNRHHIMVLGLGSFGTAMLNELSNYMVANGLWGTIEVFDRNLEQNINNFMYSTECLQKRGSYSEVETEENAVLSVDMETEAGLIRSNYYQANIGELKFSRYLETIVQKECLTEVLFCIDNISVNFECYRLASALLKRQENVKMYFRVGGAFRNAYDAIELSSDKFHHLPDGFPDMELFE